MRSYSIIKLASDNLRKCLIVVDFLHNTGQQFSILIVVYAKCVKKTAA